MRVDRRIARGPGQRLVLPVLYVLPVTTNVPLSQTEVNDIDLGVRGERLPCESVFRRP